MDIYVLLLLEQLILQLLIYRIILMDFKLEIMVMEAVIFIFGYLVVRGIPILQHVYIVKLMEPHFIQLSQQIKRRY